PVSRATAPTPRSIQQCGRRVGPGYMAPNPERPTPAPPADGASLFTALQEQLGLRLEARRAPVNVFVLETAERPEE
ncbi:MAG: DUF3738 domain-containing protein, partial [Vicinamibacterales bacterium]